MSDSTETLMHHARPDVLAGRLVALRELVWQFIWRGVQERYKGSYLGILWAMITPLLMLAAYGFAFIVIFDAQGPALPTTSGPVNFTFMLFVGLIPFTIFSECLTQSPQLVVRNPNFVKRVVFPLEVLPVGTVGAAVIHSLVSIVIVLVALVAVVGRIPWTIVYLPLFYLPLIFLSLGLGWLLASLGVFLRDIGHAMAVAVQFLMFLSPVFYSSERVGSFLPLYMLNPLAVIIEGFRRSLLYGQGPQWKDFGTATAISLLVMLSGYAWFMKIKRAFADVI